jgi:hypothetical protein
MGQISGYNYTVISSGDAEWCGEVAAPLAKATEELVPYYDEEMPGPMKVRRAVTNDWTGLAVVGIGFFVAKHLTGKFLDDVYAQFQPNVKAFLAKVEAKLNGGNRKSQKMFYVNVWYFEYNVLVSVAVAGRNFEEVVKYLQLVPVVHSNALSWIASNGIQMPVHYYRIEDGKVSPVPMLLDNLNQAMKS